MNDRVQQQTLHVDENMSFLAPSSPRLLLWNFRPFSTEVTRTFACSSSDVIASFIARGIERGGRHHIVHAVIEVLDAELGLIEREIGVLPVLRDLGIGQPPHRAVGDYDRTEALETGTAQCGVRNLFLSEKQG
jgi:hypothetical protein